MATLWLDGRPFTPTQALAAGLNRHQVRKLVASGELRRVLHGVYVDGRVGDSPSTRAAAAACVLAPGQVLGGITAAWITGVPPLLPGHLDRPPPIQVVGGSASTPTKRRGLHGRTAALAGDDVLVHCGVAVTCPERTALDLARSLDRPDGLAYIDAMLGRGLVTKEGLTSRLARHTGHRWVEQARELVDLGDGRAESPGESWMRLRWLDAGLPAPELQIVVTKNGRVFARIDAGLPRRRFGFEYDGLQFHGPEQAAADAARRRELTQGLGWQIAVFGKGEVLGRSYAFEAAIAEMTGLTPQCVPWELRRRTYLHRRRRTATTT